MADTSIEWTQKVWNPIVGCSIHSPGCKRCYAMRMAWRLQAMASKPDGSGNPALNHYEGTVEQSRAGPVWTGKINVAPDDVLTAPLRRKKPTTYFVNSMSDLFHADVPDEVIDRVFAAMALCPQHIFQVLTKRSDRMRAYLNLPSRNAEVAYTMMDLVPVGYDISASGLYFPPARLANWPLPNVWLGVSVEDQQRADERIPDLLSTPAAIRWLSCEPLLGPVDLLSIPAHGWCFPGTGEKWGGRASALRLDGRGLDWIVVGGESGKGARPMHPAWARSLREQCAAAGVPFFFKQYGSWMPSELCNLDCSARDILIYDETGKVWREAQDDGGWIGDQAMCRVGKKRAGRLLDGVEHNGMPETKNA
jgi:protein gp37